MRMRLGEEATTGLAWPWSAQFVSHKNLIAKYLQVCVCVCVSTMGFLSVNFY